MSRVFMLHRRAAAIAAACVSALTLTACAGGVSASGPQDGGGEGFAYDAEQSAVDELIEELDPVTLVYQPEASSAESASAESALAFKEQVEDRSNGKITIDIVWGQAIAGYTEVVDALIDGRVDIGLVIPLYEPARFPAYNSLSALSYETPASPLEGELAAAGAIAEMGWEAEGVIDELAEVGIAPLIPFLNSGTYYFWCNAQNDDFGVESWEGRQVRSNTTLHQPAIAALGGSAVSMEYGETFEALQRNTVDCTLQQSLTATVGGVPEVAPNAAFATDRAFGNRGASGYMTGPNVASLPLAYRQILFDTEPTVNAEWIKSIVDASRSATQSAVDNGGSIGPMPDEIQGLMNESQEESTAEYLSDGILGDLDSARARELSDKWEEKVSELGYEDGGDYSTAYDWIDPESTDFAPIAEAIFEEVSLPHRPQ